MHEHRIKGITAPGRNRQRGSPPGFRAGSSNAKEAAPRRAEKTVGRCSLTVPGGKRLSALPTRRKSPAGAPRSADTLTFPIKMCYNDA